MQGSILGGCKIPNFRDVREGSGVKSKKYRFFFSFLSASQTTFLGEGLRLEGWGSDLSPPPSPSCPRVGRKAEERAEETLIEI